MIKNRKNITHCPHGHEYTFKNTYICKRGSRHCKTCAMIRYKKRCNEYPEKIIESSRKWQKNNPDKVKLKQEKRKLKKYNITINDYNVILNNQNNKCAICGNLCITGKKLAVDHCHKTGEVRGLLCSNCNNGLGRFKDNTAIKIAAIKYLDKTFTLT